MRIAVARALCGALLLGSAATHAETIAVDPVVDGKSFSSEKTRTFLWEAKKAAATLVFIPGGDGYLGLSDRQSQLSGFYQWTFEPLSDPRSTSGRLNVVIFASPHRLSEAGPFVASRATSDHLQRIESVVQFYKQKFGKPVWLMGHSNGAASITEFYKYLQKGGRQSMIAGMIYSGARNGSTFNSATTNLPVLFLHHEKDGCQGALVSESKGVYAQLKKVDTAKVEYVLIKGGMSTDADPCRSGYHMYNGAAHEVYSAIDSFMTDFYK